MPRIDHAALPVLRAIIQSEIDGLPVFNYDDRGPYAAALADVKGRIEKRGAVIVLDRRGATIKLAGVKASSTSGLGGALRNWRAGAGRALDKQAADRMAS